MLAVIEFNPEYREIAREMVKSYRKFVREHWHCAIRESGNQLYWRIDNSELEFAWDNVLSKIEDEYDNKYGDEQVLAYIAE